MGGAYAIGGTNSFFNPGYNTASKIEFGNDGIEFFSVAKQGSNLINATAWNKGMVIDNQGRVRLGDETVYGTHSDFKLSVDGKIVAKKIIVTNGSEWADYVFSPEYKLMPLSELKLYIEKNHHLPNIPTTAEVVEDGVDVYEINKKLLEKVEELTLYMLKLEERIKELE